MKKSLTKKGIELAEYFQPRARTFCFFLILKLSYVASYSVSQFFRRNIGTGFYEFLLFSKSVVNLSGNRSTNSRAIRFTCSVRTLPKSSLALHGYAFSFSLRHQFSFPHAFYPLRLLLRKNWRSSGIFGQQLWFLSSPSTWLWL